MSEQWYYGQNGVQKGPVSLELLQQLISGGHLKRDDLVWKEGMPNWIPASAAPELFPPAEARPIPPSPPPAPARPFPPVPGTPMSYPLDPSAAAMQSKATTALVLGICSIVPGSCCSPLGLGLGIAAVILGKNASFAPNPGPAKAGSICGLIGIAFSCIGGLSWVMR